MVCQQKGNSSAKGLGESEESEIDFGGQHSYSYGSCVHQPRVLSPTVGHTIWVPGSHNPRRPELGGACSEVI